MGNEIAEFILMLLTTAVFLLLLGSLGILLAITINNVDNKDDN